MAEAATTSISFAIRVIAGLHVSTVILGMALQFYEFCFLTIFSVNVLKQALWIFFLFFSQLAGASDSWLPISDMFLEVFSVHIHFTLVPFSLRFFRKREQYPMPNVLTHSVIIYWLLSSACNLLTPGLVNLFAPSELHDWSETSGQKGRAQRANGNHGLLHLTAFYF